MILFLVLRTYFKDVKEIGKDDLAVPLRERLLIYFMLFIMPIICFIAYYILNIILN